MQHILSTQCLFHCILCFRRHWNTGSGHGRILVLASWAGWHGAIIFLSTLQFYRIFGSGSWCWDWGWLSYLPSLRTPLHQNHIYQTDQIAIVINIFSHLFTYLIERIITKKNLHQLQFLKTIFCYSLMFGWLELWTSIFMRHSTEHIKYSIWLLSCSYKSDCDYEYDLLTVS